MPPLNSSMQKHAAKKLVAWHLIEEIWYYTHKKVLDNHICLACFLSVNSPPCSFHLPITPDDDSGYAIYIVTYTSATTGSVLVIIIFLIVAILMVRHRKNKKCMQLSSTFWRAEDCSHEADWLRKSNLQVLWPNSSELSFVVPTSLCACNVHLCTYSVQPSSKF